MVRRPTNRRRTFHTAGRFPYRCKIRSRTLRIAPVLGLCISALVLATPAGATTPNATISSFTATPPTLSSTGGKVQLTATVTKAKKCKISSAPSVSGLPASVACSHGKIKKKVTLPANIGTTTESYTFTLEVTGMNGVKINSTAMAEVTSPPLSDVSSITGDDDGYCALLTTSGVDCWGYGADGELGNGEYNSSLIPVAVEGVGGTGALTNVASLVSDDQGFCALLTTGAVDCWGAGYDGQLGNGVFYATSNPDGSAVPVQVEGVLGFGTLTGVASLLGNAGDYCALLISSDVDCWGDGFDGDLGDGGSGNSATPTLVTSVIGIGALSGVASLTGDGEGLCALLITSEVDCWGFGLFGELGNGVVGNSTQPVSVEGIGGVGTLTDVSSITGSGGTYCALLNGGGVDCWGYGIFGETGDGQYGSNSYTPDAVMGEGGVGALNGVIALSDHTNVNNGTFCALFSTSEAVCWGASYLGNGQSGESAVPVTVTGQNGVGDLSGVALLSSTGGPNCAVEDSGGVTCWGDGQLGELGNGQINVNSPTPVAVEGIDGTGYLTGVVALAGDVQGYCALLSGNGVDCWGYGADGELGNGETTNSATPVVVDAPA
jgi:alpha-tubulin suppressor-like RCC1 family protein